MAGAKLALSDVIRDYPLSYYMLHAYARLAEIDERRSSKSARRRRSSREVPGQVRDRRRRAVSRRRASRARSSCFAKERTTSRVESSRAWALRKRGPGATLCGRSLRSTRARGCPRFRTRSRGRGSSIGSRTIQQGSWRNAWEIAYPRPFADVVEREAKKNGIPAALAYAVMREESAFDPEAVSPARAFGLMQLIVPTARKRSPRTSASDCDEYEPRAPRNQRGTRMSLSWPSCARSSRTTLSSPSRPTTPGRERRFAGLPRANRTTSTCGSSRSPSKNTKLHQAGPRELRRILVPLRPCGGDAGASACRRSSRSRPLRGRARARLAEYSAEPTR